MSLRALNFVFFFSFLLSLIAFWDHQITNYLKEFVVLIHEICHATAALFTGGVVKGISLHGNEGGETIATPSSFRGSFILVVSAGYIGSSLVGGLLLRFGFQRRHTKQTMILFGLLLISISVLYSQLGDLAYFTGILWGVGILLLGMIGERISTISLVFLGTSISLYSLYDLSDFAERITETDAGILAFWMAGLTPEDLESSNPPFYVIFLGYLIASLWSILSISIILFFLKASLFHPEELDLPLEEDLDIREEEFPFDPELDEPLPPTSLPSRERTFY